MRKYIGFLLPLLVVPFFASAQGYDVWSLWGYIFTLIARVTQLLWVLTTLTFLWGLVNFMKNADNERERGNAKNMMIGSVVAFFLAVSFWGLVTFAIRAFNLSPDAPDYIPTTTSL